MLARRFKPMPRNGTAAVELAICLPFLLIVILGIWEVGRMVQAQQVVANAAREGGRLSSAGLTDATAVRQSVVNYLNANGVTGADLSMVTLTNLTDASRNNPQNALQLDQFRVTVTVPYSTIRYSTLAQITTTSTLTASADWYAMKDIPINVIFAIPAN